MRVYIFGAGASKGSQGEGVASSPTTAAPLVQEIFDDVYLPWAEYQSLGIEDFKQFREASATSGVEEWLTREWESIAALKQERTKEARRTQFGKISFYLWRMLLAVSSSYNPTNGYRGFARKLLDRDEDFGLISFNYDVLLDRALQDVFGVDLGRLENYDKLNFVKPHGSVNWFLSKRDNELSARGGEVTTDARTHFNVAIYRMFNGPLISFNRISILRPDAQALYQGAATQSPFLSLVMIHGGEYFFPLLFLPLTSKIYSFVEGFSEKVIQQSRSLLGRASEIFLIGYRARDEIIGEMLQSIRPGTRVHITGLGGARQIMESFLRRSQNLVAGEVHDSGFMNFINQVM